MSVRPAIDQIETLGELADTDMDMVVPPSFIGLQTISDKEILNKIHEKSLKRQTIVSIVDMLSDEKWIIDASNGKSAIFLYEVPLKQMVINFKKYLNPRFKFRFVEERYGFPFILTIASTMRFSSSFRHDINLRYNIFNNNL